MALTNKNRSKIAARAAKNLCSPHSVYPSPAIGRMTLFGGQERWINYINIEQGVKLNLNQFGFQIWSKK